MKPLTYFCACPQAEAIEALNWTDGLTDREKAIAARVLVAAFNHSIECVLDSPTSTNKAFVRCNVTASRIGSKLPIVDKIAEAADGIPVEFCRGAIDYFNQF